VKMTRVANSLQCRLCSERLRYTYASFLAILLQISSAVLLCNIWFLPVFCVLLSKGNQVCSAEIVLCARNHFHQTRSSSLCCAWTKSKGEN
jgi:hypothetical protein